MVSGMVILFLHGWESSPGGKKPQYLQAQGYTVLNPALPADSFEETLRLAQAAFDEGSPDVVVGSSRGGAAAMNLSIGDTPLLLICPAWKNWGEAKAVKSGTVIVHSPEDEVVPFGHSRELVEGSPGARLVELGSDHRMADDVTLESIVALLEELRGR